jgi:hypothetical protein
VVVEPLLEHLDGLFGEIASPSLGGAAPATGYLITA